MRLRPASGSVMRFQRGRSCPPGPVGAGGPFTRDMAMRWHKDWGRVMGLVKVWRADRVRQELMWHVLHALGALRWVTQ